MRHFLCLFIVLAGVVQCASTGTTRPRPAAGTLDPESSRWAARDGKVMPFTKWPGEPKSPRAVLICVHGLSGAASDFWPVGDSFPAAGYAVYGLQLRGQGNDPDISKRGDIRSRRQWIHDLEDFTVLVRKQYPQAPVYWYGESLGALIAVHTAADTGTDPMARPQGIILSSPVVGLRRNLQLSPLKNFALRAMLNFLPGQKVSLESLGNAEVQVTSQTTHRGQMQHTAHYVPAFSLRLFGEIEQLIKRAAEAAGRIRMPVLVMYTPHDPLVAREDVEHFSDCLAAQNKTRSFFPDSYHLILHDSERARALEVVRRWLDAKTGRGGKQPVRS